MRVLVTGGAGFIGSHIARRLLVEGHDVRVLDNLANGRMENLAGVIDDLEFIDGDLRNQDDVRQAVAGVEAVFHQAALGSVPRSIADPQTSFAANATGTLNILVAARDAGCRRVVAASSSSVYGDTPVLPKVETMKPNPLSPYAVSKLSGEQMCQVFARIYGLEAIALRYFNVFGPRQNPDSQYAAVIPKFLRALSEGARPTIFGDGEQSRDFTYIDNVVDANLLAATAPEAAGKVFNIAAGRTIAVNEVLRQIAELLGVEAKPIHEPERAGDVRDSLADISEARTWLGYEPKVPFEEGIKRTVQAWSASALANA